ncbi:alpha/beta fold hydrolase [Candidatus Microgenomates bacterium]|nr:MAG: alpha/beta fold hydrolase [Candidatus Microgenomates bacterium]
MQKFFPIAFFLLIIAVGFGWYQSASTQQKESIRDVVEDAGVRYENQGGLINQPHPLSIEYMRSQEYPGSEITIEQELPDGSNYKRYVTSYKSDGLKIYALLTIPKGEKPTSGWPVIIFNHGYIPPSQYRTTERYIAYTDAFSRNGYILFRPDYRGHGNSEGQATGGYGSNAYTIDVLNALASIKNLRNPSTSSGNNQVIVDTNRIGMWGHSMGGHITLRSMVVSKDIKAGVIWAGVVGSYEDLLNNWRRRNPNTTPLPGNTNNNRRSWRQDLVNEYGEPESNPEFWNSISATAYVNDISGPVQLHHGSADTSVPIEFSEKLNELLTNAGKEVELYTYPGDDHNISANLSTALSRSVAFFDAYLK